MAQQLKIAHLDETAVAQIQTLENTTGKHIMAFEKGASFAELAQEDLEKIQSLEQQLDIILLVYEL
ncbi:hypothetical protein [Candidatus Leptofilum sp.]|uniref:hypothetical protein n=1 Tax=Candidatus Leptofilum sp. TaxID=3241576 RepID=UPI003B5905C9